MITNNEQRFDEMRRRILGGYGVNFEADDTPAPLDTLTVVRTLDEPRLIEEPPKADRKAHWRNYSINPGIPKPALRQEPTPTKAGPSWWCDAPAVGFTANAVSRLDQIAGGPSAHKVPSAKFDGMRLPE